MYYVVTCTYNHYCTYTITPLLYLHHYTIIVLTYGIRDFILCYLASFDIKSFLCLYKGSSLCHTYLFTS